MTVNQFAFVTFVYGSEVLPELARKRLPTSGAFGVFQQAIPRHELQQSIRRLHSCKFRVQHSIFCDGLARQKLPPVSHDRLPIPAECFDTVAIGITEPLEDYREHDTPS
jgi:hypothetical protein